MPAMPIVARRTSHLNINCSDLERSLTFYRDLVGLEPYVRTTPTEPQPGAAFGLDQVQWDAWILRGDTGDRAVVLDLLEWIVPPYVGEAASDATTTGFNRVCFTTPDLDAAHRRMVDAGVVFVTPARTEPYGMVAVFEDIAGNRWDLLGPPRATMLDAAERDTLQRRLTAERERVSGQLAGLERSFDDLVASADVEPADDEHDPDGTTAYERAQVSSLARAARARLVEIDAALASLDVGDDVGQCATCGGPIGMERLLARPGTAVCVHCA